MSGNIDINLLAQADKKEAARMMQVCNACRYCEGYCAVFPAITEMRKFGDPEVDFLAQLCHHCGACYHACQYAPPHEFAINVPQILVKVRNHNYEEFAWPTGFYRLFQKYTLSVHSFFLSLFTIAIFLLLNPASLDDYLLSDVTDGDFYKLLPHSVMAAIPMGILLFVGLSTIISVRNYWRHINGQWPPIKDIKQAIIAGFNLKNLRGNNQSKGRGCHNEGDQQSHWRRYFHHLTFYGFMLCFAATSCATIYHYLLAEPAPYGYTSLPVLLGTIGGISLCIGTLGLFKMKLSMDPNLKDSRISDYCFIGMLFFVSLTGLLLLALRETSYIAILLAVHLGFVYCFFLFMPYSKFLHGLYRLIALISSRSKTGAFQV